MLSSVAFTNPYPVIHICQIQLGETLGTAQAIKGFANQGQRISVPDSQIIGVTEIDTNPNTSVFLTKEQDRSSGL